ncbi:MAG: GntR family transcriptional regulator [Chloroflexi bacterium]|nr:GntR family transcriptional regulator [Chloroflexota bacterium]
MNNNNHLTPIQTKRNVLADHVYDAVCEHITAGMLVPGERLREAQIAEALGVSRTPVREAFVRLEHQNLLTKEASGAYYVRRWDRNSLWEVATLRAALEGLGMQLACTNFRSEDYARLEEIIASMQSAHERGDDERLIALDIEFHSYLWSRFGHYLLQQTLEEMRAQVVYFMYITRPGDEHDYPSSHRQLVEIMKSGDCELASQAIQEHIRLTAKRAIERLEKQTP